MSSVKFSINQNQIHQGEGFLFFNILRPAPFLPPVNDGNIPPTITDPAYGTWAASKGTWLATQAYTVGQVIVDQNGNAQMCTTAGTTGASGTEPTWSTQPLTITADNGTLVWTCLGRVGTAGATGTSGNWVASFAYQQDDQIRDANGNIQWCIVGGTSATAAPTWSTAQNGITTETTGVVWFNLGPTVAAGASEGAIGFDMEGKIEAIGADQETLPIASVMTGESAGITAELKQLDLSLVTFGVPHAQVQKGLTYAALPASAQAITVLTTGGLEVIPNYCIAVLSPRRLYTQPGSSRFYSGLLQKAYAKGGKPGLGFTRTKTSMWKGEWDALAMTSLPLGARGAALIEQ